jgi:ferric-dicitrate binding protein FerR (iron transport regulator)
MPNLLERHRAAPSYWEILVSHAAQRRDRAFAQWRQSGYRDAVAYEAFMANFCAATDLVAEARAAGMPLRQPRPSPRWQGL